MRFPQVQIGQRFTYQGRQYTKTGPLTASEEGSGIQRMIMRSAEVSLLEVAGAEVKPQRQRFRRSEVESALRRFKADLAGRVRSAAGSDGRLRLDQVLQLIEQAELGD